MNQLTEPAERVRWQKGRRASTKMNLADLARGINAVGGELHLPCKVVDLGVCRAPLPGDDCIAAAEPAKRFAKGQVEIEGERTL